MMEKTIDPRPKKKGFFSILKESMAKSSEGCGPACGCHTAPPPKVQAAPEDVKPKDAASK